VPDLVGFTEDCIKRRVYF